MSSSYFKTANYKENGQIAGLADRFVNGGKELLLTKSWGPLVILARYDTRSTGLELAEGVR